MTRDERERLEKFVRENPKTARDIGAAAALAALRAPAVTGGVKNAKEEVANIEAHIRALLPESYLESIGANVQAPNHKRELHHRCMRIFADLADRLRAPAVTGEAARLLRELVALVRGECPSLLNDDSGGDARLSLAIDAALAAPTAAGAPPALVALVRNMLTAYAHEITARSRWAATSEPWSPEARRMFERVMALEAATGEAALALDEAVRAIGSPAPAPVAPPAETVPAHRFEPSALDPGVLDVVVGLRALGFHTTDSGDGVSKGALIAAGHALPFRHVACAVSRDLLFSEADRLAAVLGERWTVEASYHPPTGHCVLFASEKQP